MKIKTGFRLGDRVTYNVRGEKIPALIVAIHNPETITLTEYEIRISTNHGKAYRKDEQFRTTGNYLSLRSRPKTPEQKAAQERKALERKTMEKLKGMKEKLVTR